MPRLFFALWPDAPARESLAAHAERLAAALGGKPVPAGKIHLTLAFLGEAAAREAELRGIATGIRSRGFDLRIDRLGTFRGAKVAWAGMAEPAESLIELQTSLEGSLRQAGFVLEERPFRPHVTLVRRITRTLGSGSPIEPIAWRARQLSLVRSGTASGLYERVDEWNLGI